MQREQLPPSAHPPADPAGHSSALRSRWRALRLAGACLLALVVLRYPLGWALTPSNRDLLTRCEVEGTGSGPLVVVMHGMGGRGSIGPLLKAISSDPSLKNARVLAPEYKSAFWSNADPDLLVADLCGAIEMEAKGVSEIVLVGHSLGGMLLRDAYLQSMESPSGWDTKVSRIVLLASLNRGWTTSIAKDPLQRALVEVGSLTLPWLHVGGLYDSLRRGAPFIADMRLRWLRTMRALKKRELDGKTKLIPEVVQLRGALDTVVTDKDSADLEDTPRFRAVQIPRTDHSSVLEFEGRLGKNRVATILAEIAGRGSPGIYPDNNKSSCLSGIDETPTHVVFAVHGMRTSGVWVGEYKEQAQAEKLLSESQTPGSGPASVGVVDKVEYPWFPMVPFLFGFERRERLHYFIDRYTEFVACHPNLKSASVLAHSNGSYIVAYAMRAVSSIKVQRIAVVGSVLPEIFDWARLGSRGQVEKVANYRSSADWIVGFFPGAYDWVYGSRAELGAASVWGFDGAPAFVTNVTWFDGGHSDLINSPEARREVTKFLMQGTVPPSKLFSAKITWWLEAFGNVPGLVWVFALAVLIGLGRLIHRMASRLHAPGRPKWIAAVPLTVYLSVLFILAFRY